MRTTFPEENGEITSADTLPTQESLVSETEAEVHLKFPKKIKHRGRVLAKIYRPTEAYPHYRVAWNAGGRKMKAFPTYSEAKRHADAMVKELAKGSQVPTLSAGMAADALTAFSQLQTFRQFTGRKMSLAEVVTIACDAMEKLGATL